MEAQVDHTHSKTQPFPPSVCTQTVARDTRSHRHEYTDEESSEAVEQIFRPISQCLSTCSSHNSSNSSASQLTMSSPTRA